MLLVPTVVPACTVCCMWITILMAVCTCLAVTGMRLSSAGLPLAVLSSGTAHAYHAGMAAWMQVADALFPTSAFHSALRLPSGTPPSSVHDCGPTVTTTSVALCSTLPGG